MSDSEYEYEYADELKEPTLKNLVDAPDMKWIFVGGKGGVGKTTNSCSLATLLATECTTQKILLLSTDPAHNLSDALDQQVGSEPTPVEGFENFFAMELDPSKMAQDLEGLEDPENPMANLLSSLGGKDFFGAMPGMDELSALSKVLEITKKLDFDRVVFDTAPTGHTINFLKLPDTIGKLMAKMGGIMNAFGGANAGGEEGMQGQLKAMEELKAEFTNKDRCTFVCVCIPEFLSVYETERLVQELSGLDMDAHNLIVNQIVRPVEDCTQCGARIRTQKKYLDMIETLYGPSFHVVRIPLLDKEVRGKELIKEFSQLQLNPHPELPKLSSEQ